MPTISKPIDISSQAKALAYFHKITGNALFTQKLWAEAAEHYTKAIVSDPNNAIYYSNRASCYLHLKQYQNVLEDSMKAIDIDPLYYKAWARLAKTLYVYFQNFAESIIAYNAVIRIVSADKDLDELKTKYEKERKDVISKIIHPRYISLEILSTLARAHDIPVPPPASSPTNDLAATRAAVFSHPLFGHEPNLRLLFIPESPTEPLRQIELSRTGATIDTLEARIGKLLGCEHVDSEVLHSEEQVALARGKPYGVGLGRMHVSYEFYLDKNAVSDRLINHRASVLLRRPKVHGPAAVMKTTFIKRDMSPFGKSEDILCWDRITEEELKSEEFKNRRAEWDDIGRELAKERAALLLERKAQTAPL